MQNRTVENATYFCYNENKQNEVNDEYDSRA